MRAIMASNALPRLGGIFSASMLIVLAGCNTPQQEDATPAPGRGESSHSSSNSDTTPSSSEDIPIPVPTDSGSSSPATPAATTTELGNLSGLADLEVRAALLIQQQQVEQGLLSVTTYYCSSSNPLSTDAGKGSLTITFDDTDPPGQSTGDSFSVAHNDCELYGQVYSGASTFKVVEISGSPYSTTPAAWRVATAHDATLTITGTSSSATLKSGYAFDYGTSDGVAFHRDIQGRLEYTNTSGSATTSMKNTFDNKREWDVNANTFSQSINNGAAMSYGESTFITLAPVNGTIGQAPDQGQVRTTLKYAGASPIVTTYTALGNGNVNVELDANGDGVVDAVYEQSWFATPIYYYFY